MRTNVITLALLASMTACSGGATSDGPSGAASITEGEIAHHIEVLASDEFGGRAPSSPGEELTVAYLAEEFASYGLRPGNGDSFFQDVPLVDITVDPERAPFTITGQGDAMQFAYAYADDVVTWTTRVVESSSVSDSEMVFVGYGIVAPEYGWNDYEGVDATGKTVVILVNDPGYATQDDAVFNGNSMTYYGRWTYKFEEAARQGAAAALIVRQAGGDVYDLDGEPIDALRHRGPFVAGMDPKMVGRIAELMRGNLGDLETK